MPLREENRFIVGFVLLAALSLAGCSGGGDNVITGLGNSGNVFGDAGVLEMVAAELSSHEGTPAVTDEEIVQLYQAVREGAMRGEPDAALILLRLAAYQRVDDDED